MALRRWLQRLDRQARGRFASFELLDGTTFYYDPRTLELFMHWVACSTAGHPDKWPDPPEAVRAVAQARDPEAALEAISGGAAWIPYDVTALLTERVIRPRSLVAGLDVYEQGAIPDLSEPEVSREDGS